MRLLPTKRCPFPHLCVFFCLTVFSTHSGHIFDLVAGIFLVKQKEFVSSFYRRLFTAYSRRPKNEREKIIHKENYELLTGAAKRGLCVCISLIGEKVYNKASVYAVELLCSEVCALHK